MSDALEILKSPKLISSEKTVGLILDALHDLVNYELAVVMSFEDENTLKVRDARGPLYTPKLDEFSLNLNIRKDLATIIQNRKPYLFDENEHHVDTYDGVLELPEHHSCLVTPLYIDETPLGILTFDHSMCSQFTPDVVNAIGSLSKLISVALAQAEVSGELAKKTETLLLERNTLLTTDSDAFNNMIGNSPKWRDVLDSVKLVAASKVPVLITGETGTGKEETARTIHRLSIRHDKPFVPINCSTLVSSLAESELFGHEKGAFTGAVTSRKGRFELANGGTLFLDEVGDLPINLQPKLLRVLQNGTFERVGGEKPIEVDVRIISATNVNLAEAVAEGKFREDLLYRLDVFPIKLPPLRERLDDLFFLTQYFISNIQKREGFENVVISNEAMQKLKQFPWLGNVRELKNVIERASILARAGVILPEHLIPGTIEKNSIANSVISKTNNSTETSENHTSVNDVENTGIPIPKKIESFDDGVRYIIKTALEQSNGRIYGKGGAAELLKLKPTTLQSKIKKLKIEN